MVPLQKVSFVLLSQESAEAKQIMHQIINSRAKQQAQLNISIMPFLSSVCDGWVTLFKSQSMEIDFPNIENIPFDKLVKSTRVSYKLYSDKKHNKINNKLQKAGSERLALLKTDYNFLQGKFIKRFGQKDLGVFTLDDVPYGNTSQLSIYSEKILDLKSTESLRRFEKNSSSLLMEYSEYLASFINSVLTQPFKNSIDENKRLLIDSKRLKHNDYFFYDKKRKNLLGGNLPVDTQLFLFNIFCQNNFMNNVMPMVFQTSGSFFYRFKLQAYLTSINSLSLILKKYSHSINERQTQTIKQLVEEKEKYFTFENELRNNIFHYGIKEIPISIFKDANHYFEEMIEYSVGIDFDYFIKRIDLSFSIINQLLCDLVRYNL